MHEYNHFILGKNRVLRWHDAITMRPWCIHFRRERNAKNNEKLIPSKYSKQQQTALFARVPGIFFKWTSRHKKQKIGGGNWRSYYDVPLYLVHVSHHGRFGQPRTNWRRGRLQKAATTTDRYVVHMYVCFFGLVATCDFPGICPTQKLPLFVNLIQMGPRKTWHAHEPGSNSASCCCNGSVG